MAESFKNLRATSESLVFQQVLRSDPNLQRRARRERDPMAVRVGRAQAQGAENVITLAAVLRGYNPDRLFTDPIIPVLPEVIGITPAIGLPSGGTHVVIEVVDSVGISGAKIGGLALLNFQIDDATHISGDTQPHAVGEVDLEVTNPFGTRVVTNAFSYELDVVIYPASMDNTRCIAWDGAALWMAANNGNNTMVEGTHLQKIDTSLDVPAVTQIVDVSQYTNAGEGGITSIPIRSMKHYGGYLFVCIADPYPSVDYNQVAFLVIVEAATGAIVGAVREISSTFDQRGVRAVTFDGAGNFFIGTTTKSAGGSHPGFVRKFAIADALAAFPEPLTAVDAIWSRQLTAEAVEEMDFDGTSVWVVHGQKLAAGIGKFTRINGSTSVETVYTLGFDQLGTDLTGYQAVAVKWAGGRVWMGLGSGVGIFGGQMSFDPVAPDFYVYHQLDVNFSGGMGFGWDGDYVYFAAYQGETVFRIDPSTALVVNEIGTGFSGPFGQPTDIEYDGAGNLWVLDRDGPVLYRCPSVVTNIDFDFSIENGDPGGAYPLTIEGVFPNIGDPAGGGVLRTIKGTGFTGATSATADGLLVTDFTVVNDMKITCRMPAHAVGPVDIIVNGVDGPSAPLVGGYEYFSPPTSNKTLHLNSSMGVTEVLGAVSQWADQSGNGRDFTQSGGNKPVLDLTSFNGRPGISTDGITQFLVSVATFLDIANINGWQIYLAARVDSNSVNDPNSWDNPAFYSESAGDWGLHVKGNITPFTLRAYHFGATFEMDADIPLGVSVGYVFTHRYDGSILSVRRNLGTPIVDITDVDDVGATGGLYLGTNWTTLVPIAATYAELIAYDIPHDTPTGDKIARYMMAEWGLPQV